MIAAVSWQYVIMDISAATGYRAKRRLGGAPYPVPNSGIDSPMANNWISAPAPATIPYGGRDFILAFWSLTAHDLITGESAAQIQLGNFANDSHVGGVWIVTAKAYYVWNFGHGPGDNAVLIDAFDIELGDFIPDDFVDVTPDQGGALTAAANNGYIDTTTQIPKGATETIKARDRLPGKKFGYWVPIGSLLYSNDPMAPATVGMPDIHDIVAHYNDVVIAFAFYNEVEQAIGRPQSPVLYNPWWWIETHGGLVPPGPPGPWLREFAAALALADSANRVAPELRASVLKIALRQLSVATATIRKEIDAR